MKYATSHDNESTGMCSYRSLTAVRISSCGAGLALRRCSCGTQEIPVRTGESFVRFGFTKESTARESKKVRSIQSPEQHAPCK